MSNSGQSKIRVATWNVNGLRSVIGKGFWDWWESSNVDFALLQEIKTTPEELADFWSPPVSVKQVQWRRGEKKGYSGVMTLSRHSFSDGEEFVDGEEALRTEGRVLAVKFGEWQLVNAYFPNSQREHGRLSYKLEFCAAMGTYLQRLSNQGKKVALLGDINIAHTEIDLANPKSNKNNAGFLPQEREWMSGFLASGWLDGFRVFEKTGGHYTWWSQRPGVRERNIGWRLDGIYVNASSRRFLESVVHEPTVRGSDHCPVIATLSL